MATLLKCGALFLHIPKTGGMWVTDVLERCDLVFANVGEIHCNLTEAGEFERWFRVSHRYGKPNRPLFKFCFVRHPLTWYESYYRMMVQRGWRRWGDDPNVWHPTAMLDGLGADRFEEFLANVLERRPGFVSEMYGWYTNQGIHFIGRQERLVDDLLTVLRYLQLEVDEQRIRQHPPVNAGEGESVVWPADLLKTVLDIEKIALHRFGYKACHPREGDVLSDMPRENLPLTARDLFPPFAAEEGYAWKIVLPELSIFADCLADPFRSTLALYEDNQLLGGAHQLHMDIRNLGRGRYSHWNSDLIFSTSDNSNPNHNGRRYSFRFAYGSPPGTSIVSSAQTSSPH